MAHECKALIIQCMDFRFHSAIRDFLVSMGLKDQYDLISVAGAAKVLVDGDSAGSETMQKQIEISLRLHKTTDVYIIHHMDCGAYGGHTAFESSVQEREKQAQDMAEAQRVISEKFPPLSVHKALARIEERDGKNQIDFEIIT